MYLGPMRRLIAEKLRDLAMWLDGREVIDRIWHQTSVQGMTRYIGRTERYIADLEKYIERGYVCVVCECYLIPEEGSRHCDTCRMDEDQYESWRETYLFHPVEELRKKHGRFDTQPMVEAGVWP